MVKETGGCIGWKPVVLTMNEAPKTMDFSKAEHFLVSYIIQDPSNG